MKYLLPLLLFVSLNILAEENLNKEWKTDFFSILLPDSLRVKTDKKTQLTAIGKNGLFEPPHLVIEFGEDMSLEKNLESLERSMKNLGGTLRPEACSPDCRAYCSERPVSGSNKQVYAYHLLVEAPRLTFMISYIHSGSIKSGRAFVKQLSEQIRFYE